jgi:hypothetical protein
MDPLFLFQLWLWSLYGRPKNHRDRAALRWTARYLAHAHAMGAHTV